MSSDHAHVNRLIIITDMHNLAPTFLLFLLELSRAHTSCALYTDMAIAIAALFDLMTLTYIELEHVQSVQHRDFVGVVNRGGYLVKTTARVTWKLSSALLSPFMLHMALYCIFGGH